MTLGTIWLITHRWPQRVWTRPKRGRWAWRVHWTRIPWTALDLLLACWEELSILCLHLRRQWETAPQQTARSLRWRRRYHFAVLNAKLGFWSASRTDVRAAGNRLTSDSGMTMETRGSVFCILARIWPTTGSRSLSDAEIHAKIWNIEE